MIFLCFIQYNGVKNTTEKEREKRLTRRCALQTAYFCMGLTPTNSGPAPASALGDDGDDPRVLPVLSVAEAEHVPAGQGGRLNAAHILPVEGGRPGPRRLSDAVLGPQRKLDLRVVLRRSTGPEP
jgi:hypothetical protein